MDGFLIAAVTALWLGILTSISPCPLATNIAAISFMSNKLENRRIALASGLSYTLGRAIAYLAVAVLAVKGITSVPGMSQFLQKNLNIILGPLLIVVGIMLLGIFSFNMPGFISGEKVRGLAEKGGVLGAGLMGILFALSFCPVSAGLFFGSLIPLSVKHESSIILPVLFGIGTGLVVAVVAILIAFGAGYVGKVFDKLTAFEKWARRITAVIFILVGIYYCMNFIFKLSI